MTERMDPNRRSDEITKFKQDVTDLVIGQSEAVEALVDLYQVNRAGLTLPSRTLGNLLFLGPTGVGKTRLIEAAAVALYGDQRAFVKVNCAEFQHSHEIAKLVGSPPGYLGHRETAPVFTQEALDKWHNERVKVTLVLFDEIEKASDSVWKLMLGILDKGELTLGDNRLVNFHNCLITMTSNLGAHEIQALHTGGSLGFRNPQHDAQELHEKIDGAAVGAAERKFTPEFMNRIDKVVVFHLLSHADLREVLDIELELLQDRVFAARGLNKFVFTLTDAAKEHLLADGYDPRYGARHLRRSLEKNLVRAFSSILASGQVELGDLVVVDWDGTEFVFTREARSESAIAAIHEALQTKLKEATAWPQQSKIS